MEGRRKQRGDYYRRSQNKKPPRGTWKPTVPSWEKDFCKAVGTLEWETLLQMKKFMHLYNDVLNWDDSAGEESFHNAKKRYWAEINSLSYDTPLPDPDLYIDQVNWDSEIETETLPDVENKSLTPAAGEEHDPVLIFGDSLMSNQAFSPSGWGDDEENVQVSVNNFSPDFGDQWEQNRRNTENNLAATTWTEQYNYGSGPDVSRGSNWNDWDWSCADNNNSHLGSDIKDQEFDRQQSLWSECNYATPTAGGYVWASRDHHYRNHAASRKCSGRHKAAHWGQQSGVDNRAAPRKWKPVSSCGPVGHHAAMTVGHAWNQEKPIS